MSYIISNADIYITFIYHIRKLSTLYLFTLVKEILDLQTPVSWRNSLLEIAGTPVPGFSFENKTIYVHIYPCFYLNLIHPKPPKADKRRLEKIT